MRSSESKLSPSRLVCKGASKRASTFNRNSPRNRALCSLSLSLCLYTLKANVECSFTREVVGVPGNFEQRLVLGHDKPPSGARRPARSSGSKGTCQTRSRRAIYPPRNITGGPRAFSAPLLIIRLPDMHTERCWPSFETGQRAHRRPPRATKPHRGSTKPMQIDPFLLLLWLRFRQLVGNMTKKKSFRPSSQALVNIWVVVES